MTTRDNALVLRLLAKIASEMVQASSDPGADPHAILDRASEQLASIEREEWRDGTPPGFKDRLVSSRDMVEWFGVEWFTGPE